MAHYYPEDPSHFSLPILFNNVLGVGYMDLISKFPKSGQPPGTRAESVLAASSLLKICFLPTCEGGPDPGQPAAFFPDPSFSTQEALHSFLERSTASENKYSQFLSSLHIPILGEFGGYYCCQQGAEQSLAVSTWCYSQVL